MLRLSEILKSTLLFFYCSLHEMENSVCVHYFYIHFTVFQSDVVSAFENLETFTRTALCFVGLNLHLVFGRFLIKNLLRHLLFYDKGDQG